eukprot:gene12391-6058_t
MEFSRKTLKIKGTLSIRLDSCDNSHNEHAYTTYFNPEDSSDEILKIFKTYDLNGYNFMRIYKTIKEKLEQKKENEHFKSLSFVNKKKRLLDNYMKSCDYKLDELKNDIDYDRFLLDADINYKLCTKNKNLVYDVPENLKNDKIFMIKVIKLNGEYYDLASDNLKKDPEFLSQITESILSSGKNNV